MKERFFRWWVGFLDTHRIPVLAIVILLTAYCAFNISKLTYTTSVADLLPEHNQVVQNYMEVVKGFGVSEDVVLAIHNADADTQDMELFLDIFTEKLKEDPRFSTFFTEIDYNITQKLDLLFRPFFLEHASLLLPEESLDLYLDKLSDKGIQKNIKKARKYLETGTGASFLIEKDPLSLLSIFSSLSGEVKGKFKLDFTRGFYFSKDHRELIAFIKTTQSAEDVNFTTDLVTFLLEKRELAMKEFMEETDGEGSVDIGFTGAHIIAYYDRDVMQNDMSSTFLLSFLAVMLFFVFSYKSPFSFFYASVPLIVGEVWTFGLAYLFVDSINILTGVTAAIIVGLGIDFAIHVYSRFLDEYVTHKDVVEALQITLSETGVSTVAGAVTTAAAFLTMTFSSFKGLREFGIVSSVGILSTLLAVLLLLPLMLVIRKKLYRPRRLTRFGLHFFHSIIDRYYKQIFIFCTVCLIILAGFALNLRFTTDMRQLRSQTNPALTLQTSLTEKLGASFRSISVVLTADSEEQLADLYKEFVDYLNTLNVARVESIYSIVPLPDVQQKNVDYLKSQKITGAPVESFRNAFNNEGLTFSEYCENYIDSLNTSLSQEEVLTLKKVSESDIYPVFANLLKLKGDTIQIIVNVFPKNAMWNKHETQKLIDNLNHFFSKPEKARCFFTGIDILVNEIKSLIKNNFYTSSLMALITVYLIVFLHYMSFRRSIVAFFPLATGLIGMLGTLKLTGNDITLFNFMATPMLIGIGIDDGIHLFDRFLKSEKGDITDTVIHTGKAITFTSITTIIGFGSLFISHFEGFVSLGLTTIYGVFFCWFASLFYFPSFLKMTNMFRRGETTYLKRKKRKKHKPHD